MLPKEARSPYFDRWFEIQAGHLRTARESFDPLPFFEGRLFDREMVGTALLDRFARSVFGETDPTRVLYRDRPMEVKKEGKGYSLYLRLPFAEKDRLQVFTHGDELVIQVDNQKRNLLLPRTLSSRRLLGATLTGGMLGVSFGEKESHGKE